jgi:hypothetical protein
VTIAAGCSGRVRMIVTRSAVPCRLPRVPAIQHTRLDPQ